MGTTLSVNIFLASDPLLDKIPYLLSLDIVAKLTASAELMKENPGQESGGLSKAGDDMEEVIDDFRKRQVNRRTQERQERILSRMLDSQKSLTQKDYSEKRKSTTAEKIIYSGPTGLPADKGEREMLLINAMESALQEGHSREYQNMIKQYFRNLQKEKSNSHE